MFMFNCRCNNNYTVDFTCNNYSLKQFNPLESYGHRRYALIGKALRTLKIFSDQQTGGSAARVIMMNCNVFRHF